MFSAQKNSGGKIMKNYWITTTTFGKTKFKYNLIKEKKKNEKQQ
jgi:hypothetical protein